MDNEIHSLSVKSTLNKSGVTFLDFDVNKERMYLSIPDSWRLSEEKLYTIFVLAETIGIPFVHLKWNDVVWVISVYDWQLFSDQKISFEQFVQCWNY